MASPDAGARPPQLPTDESSDSNLSELPTLESSGHDRRGACRWRTARHYDRECSRYFDCPSHIVERALSDGEPEETDGGHQEQVEAGPSSAQDHDPEPHSDSDAVSSLSEDADEDDGDERPRSPSPEAPAGTDEVTERPLRDSQPPERAVFQSQNSDHGLVSPALPTMPFLRTRTQAEPDSGLHVPPVSSPTRRGGVVFEPPMTGRPVSGSASPTRMVSRISPSPSATPGPSRPPEVSLPRWQPDSEVTYCPICGTQFSFFIRKHHCR